jgi:DNA-binding NtrC family response regulator
MYRLNILHLALPSLRARTGDAERLAQHFVRVLCAKHGLPVKTFDEPTLAWIRSYHWPGNVRELENWVHRQLLMADDLTIRATLETASDSGGVEHRNGIVPGIDNFQHAKAEAVRLFEREYVIKALRQAGGNVTRAAQLAGKERRAFGKLLKKHHIDRRASDN